MDWQQLITTGLVALAAAYLAARTYRRWTGRQAAGCSACRGCDAGRAAHRRPFVSADKLGAPRQEAGGRRGKGSGIENNNHDQGSSRNN